MRPPRVAVYSQGFDPLRRTQSDGGRRVETVRVVRSHRGKKRYKPRDQETGLVPPCKSNAYPTEWDTSNPECSLNLFCRRTRRGGYVGHQIQAIDTRRYDRDEIEEKIRRNPRLVYNDWMFFEELNRAYYTQICGFWRRWFALKTLRTFQLVQVS